MHGKKLQIRVVDLAYYFDGQACDRLQSGEYSRRLGEVLALRQKLLGLSGPRFDATIQTITGLVKDQSSSADSAKPKPTSGEASELFEAVVGGSSSGGPTSVGSI